MMHANKILVGLQVGEMSEFLVVALNEKLRDQQRHYNLFSGGHEFVCTLFKTIHHAAAFLFQCNAQDEKLQPYYSILCFEVASQSYTLGETSQQKSLDHFQFLSNSKDHGVSFWSRVH